MKAPKNLPWHARKAGVSIERAEALGARPSVKPPPTPAGLALEFWGAAEARFLDLLKQEQNTPCTPHVEAFVRSQHRMGPDAPSGRRRDDRRDVRQLAASAPNCARQPDRCLTAPPGAGKPCFSPSSPSWRFDGVGQTPLFSPVRCWRKPVAGPPPLI